jgi:hypothetical protein
MKCALLVVALVTREMKSLASEYDHYSVTMDHTDEIQAPCMDAKDI